MGIMRISEYWSISHVAPTKVKLTAAENMECCVGARDSGLTSKIWPPEARRIGLLGFFSAWVGGLPKPTGLRHVAIQDAVQLLDSALCEGHLLCACVNQPQGITVASDFLFGTALGRGIFEYQRLEPVGCNHYAFEAVGGLRRFDDCHLPQITQHLWRLGDI